MSGQPSGTVTLVFTDIEGSTRLLRELGQDGYRKVLDEHRRVVRSACAARDGYEVDYEGDSFIYAFRSAAEAVAAVEEAMRGLASGPIRIRVGIHTGEPGLDPPKYVGLDVHRAARIMAGAHGRQVLLSRATRDLIDVEVTDLGLHRFKDIPDLERVFQLGTEAFPPLRSLVRSNLPVLATPFLGRRDELAAVAATLAEEDVRLVSLVGPGGTGKTRLALQAAAQAAGRFPDGLCWVPLAPLRDAALVLPAVAASAGIHESSGGTALDDLAEGLAGRRLLMLIDNAEHLLPAAAEAIEALVVACPSVAVVVTTRERLRSAGERVYAVPPMSEFDGEILFRSRAADAGVELRVSDDTRALCARLDNLPLAMELAAARTIVFTPAQLLERLGGRLDLLGRRGRPDGRQETLHATIGWSHDLLDAEEQVLFRRLSVFAGGCTLKSAEEVAGADAGVLQSLLEKSLLRRQTGGRAPRFWMLETIREFAAERLAAAGESNQMRRLHLDHFALVVESCFDETLRGRDDVDRLEREHANLLLALDSASNLDAELALAMAGKMAPAWLHRGELREGRERLAATLELASGTPSAARARALRAAAWLAYRQSDLQAGRAQASAALAVSRDMGNHRRDEGAALSILGLVAFVGGDQQEAMRLFEGAAEAHRSSGDTQLARTAIEHLAVAMGAGGNHQGALPLLVDVVTGTRQDGTDVELTNALNSLGVAQDFTGATEDAKGTFEECIALCRKIGFKWTLAIALEGLGHVVRATAPADALGNYAESLRLHWEMENPRGIAYGLEGGAVIFADRGNPGHATALLGAASAIRERSAAALSHDELAELDIVEAQCRDNLSDEQFNRAWDEGAALTTNAAADWALQSWEEGLVVLGPMRTLDDPPEAGVVRRDRG